MMRRKLLVILTLIVLVAPKAAGRTLPYQGFFDRFTVGLEWGYTQCFLLARDYNFISEEGYRIFEQQTGFNWHANAQLLLSVGHLIGEHSSLTLYSGYMGVGKDNRLIPLQLRYSFFPSQYRHDGPIAYAQGGVAWHIHTSAGRMGWLGGLGGGYRVRLSYDTYLDLLVGVKYLHDHPSIPNPEGPGNVPERNIRKNNAGYCALDISIALSF